MEAETSLPYVSLLCFMIGAYLIYACHFVIIIIIILFLN